MAHALTKIWVHLIFSTKDRAPLIHMDLEEQIYSHLVEELQEMNCPTKIINGTADHIHILFLHNAQLALSALVKTLKGESSHWINQQDLLESKFAWQVGYAAFSVSESSAKTVANYIAKQKEHHETVTFEEEYRRFLGKMGLE